MSSRNEEVFNNVKSIVHNGFIVDIKEGEVVEIEFDITKVKDRGSLLTIVKYENGNYKVIDTEYGGDKIKALLDKGTYTIMDSEIVLRELNIDIKKYMD